MQDRFKFRVWDKFCETWLTDFAINQDGEINKFFNSEEALKRRFVLMQCTGLKDKNGKLIYEGDILKDKYGALHPITWNVKGFYEADTFAVAGFYNAIQEDMEVIGNIYENEVLLNDKN